MPTYIVYNAGIKTGSKYLNLETAYFLGGIYAADEHGSSSGKLYWEAPVRYNPTYSSGTQTTEHFEHVKIMAKKLQASTVMKDSIVGTSLDSGKNRLPGFITLFESTGLTDLSAEIPNLRKALLISPDDVKKAFILGVIDGRGTPDVNVEKGIIRYLSLDCPSDEIGAFLDGVLSDFGLDCNYNTARDRLEGGRPRKPQLRIKDVEKYMRQIGYISPAKFRRMADVYDSKYGHHSEADGSSFLPGLKYLMR